MHPERIARVLDLGREHGVRQILLTDMNSIFYLTGRMIYTGSRLLALLLREDGQHRLFLNQLYAAPAGLEIQLGPRQEEKLERELAIAYSVCAAPDGRLYLSCPRVDASGQECAPCFLWERLAALFPETGERQAQGADSRLAAPQPALELAGASQPLMAL